MKYQSSTTLGSKDIKIRKVEFVKKNSVPLNFSNVYFTSKLDELPGHKVVPCDFSSRVV